MSNYYAHDFTAASTDCFYVPLDALIMAFDNKQISKSARKKLKKIIIYK